MEKGITCFPDGRDLRKMEREDLRGAMQEDILPERSTMNTTSGFVLLGRLNLGMRMTMRAFELGIVGCSSSSAAGKERLALLMMSGDWVKGGLCYVHTKEDDSTRTYIPVWTGCCSTILMVLALCWCHLHSFHREENHTSVRCWSSTSASS
jgi:hypothetical protein